MMIQSEFEQFVTDHFNDAWWDVCQAKSIIILTRSNYNPEGLDYDGFSTDYYWQLRDMGLSLIISALLAKRWQGES